MAWEQRISGGSIAARGAAAVSAVTFDSKGNYLSGGIPQGTVVVVATGTGNDLEVVLPAAAGAIPLGVALSAPATGPGESVEVQFMGLARVQASAAITVGQLVYIANTSGQVGPVPADGATSVYLVGQALEPAAQAGDFITIQLFIGGTQHVTV